MGMPIISQMVPGMIPEMNTKMIPEMIHEMVSKMIHKVVTDIIPKVIPGMVSRMVVVFLCPKRHGCLLGVAPAVVSGWWCRIAHAPEKTSRSGALAPPAHSN